MEQMITGDEINIVWSVVGKIGVAIGVIVALIKGFQYLVSLTPTSRLEQRVKAVEEHDQRDLERFRGLESRIDSIEKKLDESEDKMVTINEGVTRLGKSQILLLRHFVSGNGQKEMSEEADELTAYFIERR